MKVSEILEDWYNLHKRDLPWRSSDAAYNIWLSEIIMQQTRVNQGLTYYNNFVAAYPSVQDLAAASLDDVLRLWQGLGYYSRARNMHITAKTIVTVYGGIFPGTYKELIKLKGIGAYTAAAIASMAFKEPVALVDGNVHRVLSRLFGVHTPIDTAAGKAVFNKLAHDLLNHLKPDIHNQAIMEFGALVCLPKNPQCLQCVLASVCQAYILDLTASLPVKKKKIKGRVRYFNYIFPRHNGKTFLLKRVNKDIWHSLFEFPLIETSSPTGFDELTNTEPWKFFVSHSDISQVIHTREYRHLLTHQTLIVSFHSIQLMTEPDIAHLKFQAVEFDQISKYAIPRVIDKYLNDLDRLGLL